MERDRASHASRLETLHATFCYSLQLLQTASDPWTVSCRLLGRPTAGTELLLLLLLPCVCATFSWFDSWFDFRGKARLLLQAAPALPTEHATS